MGEQLDEAVRRAALAAAHIDAEEGGTRAGANMAATLAWAFEVKADHAECGRMIPHYAGPDNEDGWQPGEIDGFQCPVHGLFFRPTWHGPNAADQPR